MKKPVSVDGNKIMFAVGLVALTSLLLYNMLHTGSMLARYANPAIFGYIAAFGIEASIIWTSWKIGKLRKFEINVFKTVSGVTLIVTVLVSMFANASEGFFTKYNVELTSWTIADVNIVQIIFGVFATAIVPFIVFSLSEVLSGDSKKLTTLRGDVVKENTENHIKTPDSTIKADSMTASITVPQTKQKSVSKLAETKTDKQQIFINYVQSNPNASYREIIRATNVVSNPASIKQLAESVGYHKNGNGWERK